MRTPPPPNKTIKTKISFLNITKINQIPPSVKQDFAYKFIVAIRTQHSLKNSETLDVAYKTVLGVRSRSTNLTIVLNM